MTTVRTDILSEPSQAHQRSGAIVDTGPSRGNLNWTSCPGTSRPTSCDMVVRAIPRQNLLNWTSCPGHLGPQTGHLVRAISAYKLDILSGPSRPTNWTSCPGHLGPQTGQPVRAISAHKLDNLSGPSRPIPARAGFQIISIWPEQPSAFWIDGFSDVQLGSRYRFSVLRRGGGSRPWLLVPIVACSFPGYRIFR